MPPKANQTNALLRKTAKLDSFQTWTTSLRTWMCWPAIDCRPCHLVLRDTTLLQQLGEVVQAGSRGGAGILQRLHAEKRRQRRLKRHDNLQETNAYLGVLREGDNPLHPVSDHLIKRGFYSSRGR